VRFGTDPTRLWKATAYAFDAIDQLDYLSIQGKHKGNNAPLTVGCLSDEQIAFCKDSFKKFDKDGNNRLSVAELCSVLRAVARPYSTKGVQEAMNIITGRPNSNSISFEEFATLLQSDLLKERSKRLPERFKFFDVDGSGTISLEELRVCIRNIDHLVTNAEIEAMLKTADSSGDGQISYEEFDRLFQELH
jgi:Ca2+-binding EF-hand superfamily protein